jgi:hypothetical protein
MGVLMIFIAFLFSLTQTKKIKEYVNRKNSRTILVIKIPTLSSLLWVVNSIAEINYEIFSIRPKAYSYLISVQHYYF